MSEKEELILTSEAAELLKLATGTLQNWRTRGGGPPYIRIGGRIVYDREATLAWARSKTRTATTEPVEQSAGATR